MLVYRVPSPVFLILLLAFIVTRDEVRSASAFRSYGEVFPPLNHKDIPPPSPNATVLTLCELWENDSIPVTPGISIALTRIAPHFRKKNIEFKMLRQLIPSGCGDNTILAAAPALVDMHINQAKTGCNLLIGPSCTESMYNVRGLAMNWDIPTVTSGASGIKFDDKRRTTVLTRFGYTQEDVSLCMIKVLDRFNWTNTVMLYDSTSEAQDFQTSYEQVLKSSRFDLYRRTEMIPLMSSHITQQQEGGANYLDDLLLKASGRARIFIISALPQVVYQILVYLTTNLIETKAHGFSDLSFFDDTAKADPAARVLLDSLLVIRMKRPDDDTTGKDDFDVFAKSVKDASRDKYNYTYGPDESVTHLVLGIWDAVMFYGVAVNATLTDGEHITSGRSVTSRIWGHSFMGVAIECTISAYGDRNFPYYLLDFDLARRQFKPVIFMDNEQQKLVPMESIHWPGDLSSPPLTIPICGFSGQEGPCSSPGLPLYAIILIIIVCVLLLSVLGGFLIYRERLNRKSIDSWKIRATDIVPRESKSRSLSSKDLNRPDDNRTIPSSTRDSRASAVSYVTTAYFRENIVAMKQLGCVTVHLTPQLLFELRSLKQMSHEHMARFVGLCMDPEASCILTEHCPKGSLTDLIDDDSITLDWAFKFSLLNDILDGIVFVHSSSLKSHGRLTANNCLIDGRFLVKIGDLGLSCLRPSFSGFVPHKGQTAATEGDAVELALITQKLYRAPELLRSHMPENGTQKGDIYSYGILLQQVIQRTGPFDMVNSDYGPFDAKEIMIRVRETMIPPLRPRVPFDACTPELYTIMIRCWSEQPADRFEVERLRSQLKKVPGNKSGNLMDDLLRRMERYALDLETLVNERTSAFMEEKKRSEQLLYQMLPRGVANKLKEGLFVEPESYDNVTIYFSDIVGFTTLGASSTPMEVVDLLNDLYTLFDGIIESFDVYKVETIGDAYVVVSGLPQRNEKRHAMEIARMSLSVIAAIAVFKIRHRPKEKLALRVGVHTGPCAAGVVGLKMPRYCIFGDSVNIASRLESTSQGMASVATKVVLEECPEFSMEYRGEVDLKGRGTMQTYWLKPLLKGDAF